MPNAGQEIGLACCAVEMMHTPAQPHHPPRRLRTQKEPITLGEHPQARMALANQYA